VGTDIISVSLENGHVFMYAVDRSIYAEPEHNRLSVISLNANKQNSSGFNKTPEQRPSDEHLLIPSSMDLLATQDTKSG